MSKTDNGFTYKDGVSLKEYFDSRITSVETSIILAHASMEKRLDSMNEFREALKDQNSRFITRNEHELVMSDIQDLKESRAELQGKASMQSVVVAYMISAISLAIGLFALFHDLTK
jgi:hypothetical protein